MTTTVARQKDYTQTLNLANQEFVRGNPKRPRDTLPPRVPQTVQFVDATSADDSDAR